MEVQNQVIRTLRSDLVRLQGLTGDGGSRGQLVDRVCAAFGFRDGRGRWQRVTCRKALTALEAEGHISLPPRRTARCGQRRVADPVPPARDVPDAVCAVEDLELVLVTDARQRAIWDGLMTHEHPCGAGPFVGCQVRYLVGSAHGWLGAVGFASSARWLACRDRWIGWNDDKRRACLHRVACLSRFLIRPGIECRNLASHVLGQTVCMAGDDFEVRYGYRPYLLETFVDEEKHTGAIFRSANWQHVGKTSGRRRGAAKAPKAVYMYELDAGWRERLHIPEPRLAPLKVGAGLDRESWAEQEFSGAPLGDARLSARLVTCARHQAEAPMRAFTGAARGDQALIKAYYRFIDKPDNEAVTVENIMQPHRRRTLQRMQGEKTVLCVQDGSTLNFAKRGKTEGLGIIGRNQTAAAARGLHLHATLAVNADGLPLGVLRAAFDAPQPGAEKDKPREEKKSYRWIEGLRDSAAAAAALDGVQVVGVMDREADFVDLFVERRERTPGVELLVRAKTNRVLGKDDADKLFDKVRKSPAQGKLVIEVKRLSARIKASKQAAKAMRPARQATVRLRYLKVELPAKGKAPVEMTIVHVREENPPADDERLEWFLLTTLPVESAVDAERILMWYGLRWRIEDYFRVLKSGCKIEELENRTAERLQRAAAINMVVAWRIHLMARLGRELPDLPPEILFSDVELQVLALFAKSRRKDAPKNLGEAVFLVAALGGYIKRKRDPPGAEVMWNGYLQLAAMAFHQELRDEYC